jgi:uncharacterized membrane protein
MDKRTLDIITTAMLAAIPLIVYFWAAIEQILPPEYLVASNIILAAISQYTSNKRVVEAVETVKKWIYFDYLTTILLTVAPWILYFQPQIMGAVPVEYVGIVSFLLAVLSQWAADKRENKSVPVEEVIADADTA